MTADMAEAKKDEDAAVLNFHELAGTKEDTIGELDEAIQQDKTALADARDAKTNGAEDVSATQDQLEKDQAFLATLEETCGNLDDNYAANQKERDHELEALGEVLAALTSDETRGLFARNTETNSFLQVVSKSQDKQARAEAIKVLNTAFRKSGDVALLSLASTVGLDAFQKVKQAIAQLGEAIEQQINDEVIARDTCIATFHDLEIAETEGNGEIKRLNALVESKTAVHTGLVADIAAAEQELGETKQSLQNRGQHYIQGSKEHQKNFEESKAMIGVLEMAKSRLGKFYSPKHPESLTQVSEAPAQTPEKLQKIAEYKKSSASSGVVIYIQQLVDDFKRDIVQREKGAQSDVDQYAKELAELQGSIKALNTKINKKHEEKATVDGEIRDGRKLRTAELDKVRFDWFFFALYGIIYSAFVFQWGTFQLFDASAEPIACGFGFGCRISKPNAAAVPTRRPALRFFGYAIDYSRFSKCRIPPSRKLAFHGPGAVLWLAGPLSPGNCVSPQTQHEAPNPARIPNPAASVVFAAMLFVQKW